MAGRKRNSEEENRRGRSRPQPQNQGAKVYKVEEVAKHFRVDATTVRRWVNEGNLQAVKLPHPGKRKALRFTKEQIREFDPEFGKDK